jgi:organic hydroperoxide reductase OsmC/OhrA
MSEHHATTIWTRSGADFSYRKYPRDHQWKFDNGIEVPASATPDYLGNPERLDPESALVAALSSCHMLTFLAVASNQGFVVDSYEDRAIGYLEKNANGKFAVTRVDLRPRIAFSGAKLPTAADLERLHDKAHRECFIANSVTTAVRVLSAD